MWSARGLVPMAYVKLDTINMGTHSNTSSMLLGDILGTSYATHLTIGSAAILMLALKKKLGKTVNPQPPSIIKEIVMNKLAT